MDERQQGATERQRLDKFLWFARVVRTRRLAQELVASGHVRINGQRAVNASHPVRRGDLLTVALEDHVRVLEVTAFAERRGGAPGAALLYRDLSPPPPPGRD